MTSPDRAWRKLRAAPRPADALTAALAAGTVRGGPGQIRSRRVIELPGVRVSDVICTSGPDDQPYDQQHPGVCVAVVAGGTFAYHGVRGRVLLTPGAVLLGEAGSPFRCSHEHGKGDRCIAFHFRQETFERLAADAGVRRASLLTHRLPPGRATARHVAAAELALDDGPRLVEVGFALAALALRAGAGDVRSVTLTARDERRAAEAIRLLEATAEQPHTIVSLAAQVGLSPYHFLRVVKRVTGITPHQWLIRARLRAAARRLMTTDEPVTRIAHDAGFGDLSNFVRSFAAEFGASPSSYQTRSGRVPFRRSGGARAAG